MKQKKILTGIIIACVIALAAIAAGIFAGLRHADSYESHLRLAWKYMEEMAYERAEAEFGRAIAIEPGEKDAYMGLAELYIAMEEYGEAVRILEEGYDQTGKSSLKRKLEEVMQMSATTYSYSDYYETGDVSVLGEVVFDFYPSEEAYHDAYRIQDHTVKKDDFGVSDGENTVVAFFEGVAFAGKDSRRIDWLNAKVEELEAQYREEQLGQDLDALLGHLAEYPYSTEWYLQPHMLASVYYDEDGAVSIGYSWEWYMGGVYNVGWKALNYQLADMRELTIYDALGVDWQEGEEMIAEALKQEGFDSQLLETVRNIGYEGYCFYFDEHKVYLCFDSYVLGMGPGFMQVELPR